MESLKAESFVFLTLLAPTCFNFAGQPASPGSRGPDSDAAALRILRQVGAFKFGFY
jgi:hypothetical protein